MNGRTWVMAAVVLVASNSFADETWTQKAQAGKTIYATLHTRAGDVTVELFTKDAPKTVENFVGLASGEKEWTDPKTGEKTHKPLYEGSIFHRIIPNFMIQGGDPLGTGMGNPGYQFADEFGSPRVFSKPGILAMANAGPNTNGSQFFITVGATPWLNGRHTIFGEVVEGYDVVQRIVGAPRGAMDWPDDPVTINSISLSEKGPKIAAPVTTPPAAVKKPKHKKAAPAADAGSEMKAAPAAPATTDQ